MSMSRAQLHFRGGNGFKSARGSTVKALMIYYLSSCILLLLHNDENRNGMIYRLLLQGLETPKGLIDSAK